ncbi:hypothetical protein [Aquincola sp. J276]|uniref:hypothetical protein n=1 Tax=Aquincola sp. J276 TaxID=2898432 RepID=UPI00215087E4|nr:hypothetical protein [Aquincola sp. J276]MCR5865690.1 hypothetical protein [Aquincola sp. J276]
MATADPAHYYEVEGAVFRQLPGQPMEVYVDRLKQFRPYTGDITRVYRESHRLTFAEVLPYMTVED